MKERTRLRGDERKNSKGIHGKEAGQDCRAKRGTTARHRVPGTSARSKFLPGLL